MTLQTNNLLFTHFNRFIHKTNKDSQNVLFIKYLFIVESIKHFVYPPKKLARRTRSKCATVCKVASAQIDNGHAIKNR